ncbi:hypothetical protein LTSEWAN_4600 [Salmonella enterica subsp. enterica serovar Wandsworth str. A4-580]|uniref:Uncharacterized protein n=1 Tax=Salmonella enterica subsp. enterica serovar Wandsworth str. A4-580 TaxID=913086 RepID=G5SGD5_SALET|nr:hypothetical protein LTSEWAN_4600 [Salmonella enterica subsp. enterica serovar Wandsworth str. A4-580]
MVIPEVLIGGINVIVDHTNYTNLRRDAQVFFRTYFAIAPVTQLV